MVHFRGRRPGATALSDHTNRNPRDCKSQILLGKLNSLNSKSQDALPGIPLSISMRQIVYPTCFQSPGTRIFLILYITQDTSRNISQCRQDESLPELPPKTFFLSQSCKFSPRSQIRSKLFHADSQLTLLISDAPVTGITSKSSQST